MAAEVIEVYRDEIKISLSGKCRVKKNGQKVVRLHCGMKKINTPQYSRWHATAFAEGLRQKPRGIKPIATPMNVSFVFYFKNHQHESDLSNLIEGPQDLLKELGYIVDDKLIYSLDGSRKIYNENESERTEITITQLK